MVITGLGENMEYDLVHLTAGYIWGYLRTGLNSAHFMVMDRSKFTSLCDCTSLVINKIYCADLKCSAVKSYDDL